MKGFSIGLLVVGFVFVLGCKSETKSINSDNNKKEDTNIQLEKGKEIASATFLALSGELQKALKSGGVEHALAYCNLNASGITDSLSTHYNTDIKRTSLKIRNPENKPSPVEEAYLKELENKIKNGEAILPQVMTDGNSKTFYAPIIMQDLCLKCHGGKESIENYNKLLELYPDDLAVGYKQGDLRGMWSISFRD